MHNPVMFDYLAKASMEERIRQVQQDQREGRVGGSRRSQRRQLPLMAVLKSLVTFFI